MKVKISRIHPEAVLPEYKTTGAACFDLATIETRVIKPGEVVYLRTGLVMQTPPGHFLAVAPRSSLHKLGLDQPHSFGILDPDFSGPEDELKLVIRNFSTEPVKVEKQQRLSQGFFVEVPKVVWQEIKASQLGKKSRGGFGSTGRS